MPLPTGLVSVYSTHVHGDHDRALKEAAVASHGTGTPKTAVKQVVTAVSTAAITVMDPPSVTKLAAPAVLNSTAASAAATVTDAPAVAGAGGGTCDSDPIGPLSLLHRCSIDSTSSLVIEEDCGVHALFRPAPLLESTCDDPVADGDDQQSDSDTPLAIACRTRTDGEHTPLMNAVSTPPASMIKGVRWATLDANMGTSAATAVMSEQRHVGDVSNSTPVTGIHLSSASAGAALPMQLMQGGAVHGRLSPHTQTIHRSRSVA